MPGGKKRRDDELDSDAPPGALIRRAPGTLVGPRSAPDGRAPRGKPGALHDADEDLRAAWLKLRGDWSWLAVIAAEPRDSTAVITRALCEVGSRLSVYPVEYIDATDVDLDSSSMLLARLGTTVAEGWPRGGHPAGASAQWRPPVVKSVVALANPLANPLALPLALAADGVVLCVRRGHDRLRLVRRTVDVVGRDRILCSLLAD